MRILGKIIAWLAGIAVFVGCGLYLLGSRPGNPSGHGEPWLTEQEAYEDQTAHTGKDGGAFVTTGLKIRDPRDVSREEGDYRPTTYAIHNGALQTLESGEVIYERLADGLQRRSVWVMDGRKCLFIDESGCLARNIYAFDGFWAGGDGSWDASVPRLTGDRKPVLGKKYREEGNPSGPYLLFDASQSGRYTVVRTYPGAGSSEKYVLDAFGRGTYALVLSGDSEIRAHLALLPDGRTALLSQAGETEKYILE